jgi:hypothetical protein
MLFNALFTITVTVKKHIMLGLYGRNVRAVPPSVAESDKLGGAGSGSELYVEHRLGRSHLNLVWETSSYFSVFLRLFLENTEVIL